jgi:hypothetical protein
VAFEQMHDDLDAPIIDRTALTPAQAADGWTETPLYAAPQPDRLRAERDAAHAAGLAEGVALGIEAAAEAYEVPKDEIGMWEDCCIDTLYYQEAAIRNLDPAAIIAERSNPEPTSTA